MSQDTIIIDGEEEVVVSRLPIFLAVGGVVLAIVGAIFGLAQKSEKDKLETKISNLEASVNTHVAEVEALVAQLKENNIEPNIKYTSKTQSTAADGEVADTKDTETTETKKSDKGTKETAGEGYADYYLDLDDWEVKFAFPSGVKYLNFIPTDTSITITSVKTEAKTYGSDVCASGFGQVVIGGSGTKLLTNNGKTYNYVAPSDSKCSGSDFETAAKLTKKLFEGIKAK